MLKMALEKLVDALRSRHTIATALVVELVAAATAAAVIVAAAHREAAIVVVVLGDVVDIGRAAGRSP